MVADSASMPLVANLCTFYHIDVNHFPSLYLLLQDVPPLTVVYKSSGSELDLRTSSIFEEPDAVTVQNHFSVVLDVIKSHCSNEHCIMVHT